MKNNTVEINGEVEVIDAVHEHIHHGDSFYAFDVVQLASGASYILVVNTNDTTLKHSFLSAYLVEELEVISYEGVTTVSDGTAVPRLNRKRGSIFTTPTMTIFHTPTTLGTGSATIVRHVRVGGKNAFSEVQQNNELILKENTKYAIVFTNRGNGTAYLNWSLQWYEHDVNEEC